MIKRKNKNKNKEMKKRKIHKIQVESQQKVINSGGDKIPMENQQEMLVNDDEKEKRRTTRLGAIIAIVAVIGTVCTFLFKITINLYNVWSEQMPIYYMYFKILFLSALSTLIIIFFDIVLFVISDLKRYNTYNQNYKQYDLESDKRYRYLLNDFRIYTIMLCLLLILIIPLIVFYAKTNEKWYYILISCILGLIGICVVVPWVVHKSINEILVMLCKIFIKFIKCFVVASFCYIICNTLIFNNKALLSVSYSADGIVKISNTSSENYNGLDIKIYDMSGNIIYKESVEKENLLFAREDSYINNEFDSKKEAEGLIINAEYLHWKYLFDLKEVINESGMYFLETTVHQNDKKVVLINTVSVNNRKYIYAKDNMEKEY